MDFKSFDLCGSNEQPTHSFNGETFDKNESAFLDFMDPSNFTTHHQPTLDTATPLTNNGFSLMSPMNTDPFLTCMNADCLEDEDFLTPLISPAIAPNYNLHFSPLTSPALKPQLEQREELQDQLAMIERQQQQLLSHMTCYPSPTMTKPKQQTLRHKIAMSSPMSPKPATPSLLMKLTSENDGMTMLPDAMLPMDKRRRISYPADGNGNGTASPRALKPLVSGQMDDTAWLLATKSNYQLGQTKVGTDHRRTAHKAAEQRRRDTLKQCFDALRVELLQSFVDEDVAPLEKKVKQMSKVDLLQHSCDYLLRLKSDNQRKDAKVEQMTMEIQQLRTRLGMAPVTEQERQAEAEEKQEQKKNRLARLKRWLDEGD